MPNEATLITSPDDLTARLRLDQIEAFLAYSEGKALPELQGHLTLNFNTVVAEACLQEWLFDQRAQLNERQFRQSLEELAKNTGRIDKLLSASLGPREQLSVITVLILERLIDALIRQNYDAVPTILGELKTLADSIPLWTASWYALSTDSSDRCW